MGFKFQFVTLAGFHSLNHGMFELSHGYAKRGMAAYSELQQKEFASEANGYTATRCASLRHTHLPRLHSCTRRVVSDIFVDQLERCLGMSPKLKQCSVSRSRHDNGFAPTSTRIEGFTAHLCDSTDTKHRSVP